MTKVGTSMRLKSFRKSVEENAVTQSRVPRGEAPAAIFQLSWTTRSLTRLPRKTSTLKKSNRNWERKAGRSTTNAALSPSKAAEATPGALSAGVNGDGGTPA